MTEWNKLLRALNQIFNSQTGATSKVRSVYRTFDNTTQEPMIWLKYRLKANILESDDLNDVLEGVIKHVSMSIGAGFAKQD